MLLPNIANADIDLQKLTDYVLNAGHPEGRHKARVFLSALDVTALDVTALDATWLASAMRSRLSDSNAVLQRVTTWRTICRVDMDIVHGKRCAKVRTGWLCTDTSTRLATKFCDRRMR